MATQFSWQSNNGEVPLMLEVQSEFTPVSGLAPTVEVYRLPDHYFADWTTLTFRPPTASGDKFGSMSEVPSDAGLYHRPFNPVTFGQVLPIQSFYVRYRVTIPSGTVIGQGPTRGPVNFDVDLVRSETHNFREMAGSGVLPQFGLEFDFGC